LQSQNEGEIKLEMTVVKIMTAAVESA